MNSKTCIQIVLLLFIAFIHKSSAAQPSNRAKDPFDQVIFVSNTTQWPYDYSTYGTKSFHFGSAESKNEDAIILDQVLRSGFHFPTSMNFGVACSSYQYEGNRVKPSPTNPDGVGWSMWDVFSEKGSWLNPYGTNIEEISPTSLFTVPNGSEAVRGFDPSYYSRDLQLVKELGTSYYRLSISWPRLFPRPHMTEPAPEAIAYYKGILEAATAAQLKIMITLYHWDLPAWLYNFGDPSLESEAQRTYGWLDMREAKDNVTLLEFQKFVAASYQAFGKYTPYFSTLNEPLTFTVVALSAGSHAPGQYGWMELQKLNPILYGKNHTENLERLPYLQAINLVKAHFIAYKTIHHLYDENHSWFNYTPPNISIVLNTDYPEPYRIIQTGANEYHYHPDDVRAAKRALDFEMGWWLDPIMFGHWPESMDFIYNDRIKQAGLRNDLETSCLLNSGRPAPCTKENPIQLADYMSSGGALDSIALNHYTGSFAVDLKYAAKHMSNNPELGGIPINQYGVHPDRLSKGWDTDQDVYFTQFRYYLLGDRGPAPDRKDSVFVIGNAGSRSWLRQAWFTYRKVLQYVNYRYINVPGQTKQGLPFANLDIYLTESGFSIYHESQKADKLNDTERVDSILGNLGAIEQSINLDQIPVKLYSYWSIVDNFEWGSGYDARFGLIWINYDDQLKREPKKSYKCFQKIIAYKSDGLFPIDCL